MTTLFLGKLEPEIPDSLPFLRDISNVASPTMPALPLAISPPPAIGQRWGMMMNDRLGCCTISGAGHIEMVIKAISGRPTVIPSDPKVEKVYFHLTGGPDAGLVELDVLRAWAGHSGLFSVEDKLAGFSKLPLDPTHNYITHRESVAYLGAAYYGIQCPASAQQAAQQQIQTGKIVPWTYDPRSPIEGGHAISPVGYNASGMICVSWGMLVLVTWEFLKHYLDEAWAPLGSQFRTGHTPLNIKWPDLDAELAKIGVLAG